jgi:1,4-dihydroxy-2-naphthoyl-CoA hydrolase
VPAFDPSDDFYGFRPRIPFEDSFDGLLGLELIDGELGDGEKVRARMAIRGELLNGRGALHGGVLAAVAEALASRGTALAAIPLGQMPQGLSNDTTSVRPIGAGVLHAEARPVSTGQDVWVWAVQMRDDAGEMCAFSRVTIAVRPRPVAPVPAGESGAAVAPGEPA